jgi:hypothetical protein
MKRALVVLASVFLLAQDAGAQRPRTAVVPDSITVGDVFRVAVRVAVPPGGGVTFPDTLEVPENVEAAARREIQVDTTAGGLTFTAIYPLTAWKPGAVELPSMRVRIQLPDGGDEAETTFPPIIILSVLPEDTAGVDPMPAKDVIGPSRLLWPMVLGAGLLAALLILGVWAWRRRARPDPVEPAVPARDVALAELERIRRLGLLERGEWKPFYSAVTGVLRGYTAAIEPAWGRDLTTGELNNAMEWRITAWRAAARARATGAAGRSGQDPLIDLLDRADLVKFAAHRPARTDAETFAWPPEAPPSGEEK